MDEFIVTVYMVVSASALAINKLAISAAAGDCVGVLALQLLTTAGVALMLSGRFHIQSSLTNAEGTSLVLSALIFCATVYANFKMLDQTSIELFVVVRASVPIATSVLDWLYLDRELPSRESAAALFGILAGVAAYASVSLSQIRVGFVWMLVWYACFLADQCYLKYVCDAHPLSTSTKVFYTNLLAGGLLLVGHAAHPPRAPYDGWLLVAASCVSGAAMSYVSWATRERLSATYFAVLGVVCKVGTLALSFVLFRPPSNIVATAGMLVAIACGAAYRQSPRRSQTCSFGNEVLNTPLVPMTIDCTSIHQSS